ncbi:MAG TPA: hypothetical protein DDZ89_21710 [Clostridiales bacterium]|nr:hypothetical protein [Clostridiales bacterium]
MTFQPIQWDIVSKKINEEQWAKDLFTGMKNETDAFIKTYKDDAGRIAGWYHSYNCEKCQGRLVFNWKNAQEHVCSVCGSVNQGELFTKIWNNMYRGMANQNVYNAAAFYQLTKENQYVEFIRKVLDFYADNYADFKCEPPAKIFEGKLMNQHLDDAVGIMTILLGLDMVKDQFTSEELDRYYDDLFVHEAELFDFFANRIYNIPLWIKCAQTMIGVFFHKEEQIQKGLHARFGVLDQLKRGVTEDGMWYEGSMHYHFYSTQPLCYLVYIAKREQYDFKERDFLFDRVEKMLEYPLKMMFQSGRLPNPNDAHPVVSIEMYKLHYEYASVIYDNPLFKEICGTFNEEDSTKGTFTSLLFNHWPKPLKQTVFGTVNNPSSYTAMLRNKSTEVYMTYGALTGLHRHPAVMNMEISFHGDVVSYDIGNGGYASELFAEWQRKSICHNTVLIDKGNQPRLPEGDVLEYDPDAPYLKVKAKAVYAAADYTRSFRVSEDYIEDSFEVNAWGEYTMDWFFYCKGNVHCPYETVPVEKIGEAEGYQYLFDIRSFKTDKDWQVEFETEDKRIIVSMAGEEGTEVFIVNSYVTDKANTRYGLCVRRKKENTVFNTSYKCIKK